MQDMLYYIISITKHAIMKGEGILDILLLISAGVILLGVALHRLTWKIGVPALLAFIVLGMVFGSDGILRIQFDDFVLSEQICSIALIIIMFYGGFGTSWKHAKPVAVKAVLLSSLGVVLTAFLTGLFCFKVLRINFWESILIGSVIGSTDAASVFSILKSSRLGLKDNTDSLLEMESGSNDPFSYMLTMTVLAIMGGTASAGAISYMVFAQIVYGLCAGIGLAAVVLWLLRRFSFGTAESVISFMAGVALLSYALPNYLGGNGYMSAYLVGIVIGNIKFPYKQETVHFFDGLTGLMQTLIFFLLGLLATPSRMPAVLLPGLLIALFLTFVARPAVVFGILSPFKSSVPQQALVSFAGLRGAASIVFAVMATRRGISFSYDLFHMVFVIVLFSILFQGSLLPFVARKLKMTDQSIDVFKTFTDYSEEKDFGFFQFTMPNGHPWKDRQLNEIVLPEDMLVVLVIRGTGHIFPNGKTMLLAGDIVVLCGAAFQEHGPIRLTERQIPVGSEWNGKTIAKYSPNAGELVILIKREGNVLIPRGDTCIKGGDTLVIGEENTK